MSPISARETAKLIVGALEAATITEADVDARTIARMVAQPWRICDVIYQTPEWPPRHADDGVSVATMTEALQWCLARIIHLEDMAHRYENLHPAKVPYHVQRAYTVGLRKLRCAETALVQLIAAET